MSFIARVSAIKSLDNLNIVEFDFNDTKLKMMSLDLQKDILVGKKVELLVKPSNIIISKKAVEDISLSNQTLAKITKITSGELLSHINLKVGDTNLESIITKDSCERLKLQEDSEVFVLIKASDISIYKVFND